MHRDLRALFGAEKQVLREVEGERHLFVQCSRKAAAAAAAAAAVFITGNKQRAYGTYSSTLFSTLQNVKTVITHTVIRRRKAQAG